MSRGLCPGCWLRDRVRELLNAGDPAAVLALEPFLARLADPTIPASTLRWLQSPARHLLIALLDGRVPLTHAGLDAASASVNHVAFLRAHLVSCGVLDARDEHSASFARAKRPDQTAASTQKHSRTKVRQAIALTRWLHHQDLALVDLRQDLLDAWVTDGASPAEPCGCS